MTTMTFLKFAFTFFYHGCFAVCQAEVAVFEDAGAQLDLFFLILKQLIAFIVDLAFAVPALAGETADGDDCGIGKCFCFLLPARPVLPALLSCLVQRLQHTVLLHFFS